MKLPRNPAQWMYDYDLGRSPPERRQGRETWGWVVSGRTLSWVTNWKRFYVIGYVKLKAAGRWEKGDLRASQCTNLVTCRARRAIAPVVSLTGQTSWVRFTLWYYVSASHALLVWYRVNFDFCHEDTNALVAVCSSSWGWEISGACLFFCFELGWAELPHLSGFIHSITRNACILSCSSNVPFPCLSRTALLMT